VVVAPCPVEARPRPPPKAGLRLAQAFEALVKPGDWLNARRFAPPPAVEVGTLTPCDLRQAVYAKIAFCWVAEGAKPDPGPPLPLRLAHAAMAAFLTDGGTVVGGILEFGLNLGKVNPWAVRQL